MHKSILFTAMVAGTFGLSACDQSSKPKQDKAVVGVVDETNLNDIMLTVADPNEGVTYFRNGLTKDPTRTDLKLGLAKSLVRAKRATESAAIYAAVDAEGKLSDQDRLDYAGALIRTSNWKDAEAQLDKIPPSVETFQRYRLEAMVADSQKKWKDADSFYQTATSLTTQPANVLNNWGYSKLSRGDTKGAERLFIEALTFDPKLFTAKNNLVLARASRGEYNLPVIQMTQIETAELTYSIGLSALKRGDTVTARNLFEKAVELHPRHFDAAVRSLKSMG